MDSVTMRIRIPSEAIREKIVRRGMWNIAGIPMVVSKWSPMEDEAKGKLTPLWVHLTKVPMSMYSWEGLCFISSAAGVPDKLHPETIACKNFEVAKVCVKADLSKQLPREIIFIIGGEEVMVGFTYPWLPSKCGTCGKWGHSEIICTRNKKEEGERQGVEKSVELLKKRYKQRSQMSRRVKKMRWRQRKRIEMLWKGVKALKEKGNLYQMRKIALMLQKKIRESNLRIGRGSQ